MGYAWSIIISMLILRLLKNPEAGSANPDKLTKLIIYLITCGALIKNFIALIQNKSSLTISIINTDDMHKFNLLWRHALGWLLSRFTLLHFFNCIWIISHVMTRIRLSSTIFSSVLLELFSHPHNFRTVFRVHSQL